MKHKYNIPDLLNSSLATRGVPYVGMMIPGLDRTGAVPNGARYEIKPQGEPPKTYTDKGSPLRVENYALGGYYFMPVYVNKMLLPNAVISLSQSKIIQKTQMPGSNGSVKEYISLDDMTIDITAVIIGEDGDYPEDQIEQIKNLWRLNEAVEIISAITDIMLPVGSRIVIEELSLDPVGQYEDVQTISIKATSDEVFELELE